MNEGALKKTIPFFRENRFAVLLIALFLLFFYGPIIYVFAPRHHALGIRITVGIAFGYLTIAAALAVVNKGQFSRTAVLLAIPALVFEIIDLVFLNHPTLNNYTQTLSHAFGMLFILYVSVQLLKFVFQQKTVTTDTIFAALCVYLMLAAFWTYAYSFLDMIETSAFRITWAGETYPKIMRLGAEPAGIEFYYSIVTMTTLGFGDVVPVTAAARSLTTLQAVVGQLYLAVLVARLVGLHVASSTRHVK